MSSYAVVVNQISRKIEQVVMKNACNGVSVGWYRYHICLVPLTKQGSALSCEIPFPRGTFVTHIKQSPWYTFAVLNPV